ncbi:MAG: twin-arginine translocase TatA/TatE family subunit [Corynebacterium sp.]|uniref:twin-arginine translocase TatA/TatE family subunit n=1 Tax=unclassified Corynebacterium TaxID=2624378 RepID=UPI002648512B|nr:twin-arginine translocase TatA/TatE family subunit [Corynebacterium sp.]MDN5583112.1 twin-arginine translocase TatA/TatE family subunit [Corynebacterium sp.]MDN5721344.1 twin-arginine translocase TatA/TatE family subunit [Corynebacterium sp.]MDN6259283.1 twin-arginine translocase TatA/TatE family subunit [Corynebacterium sp.]MDN6325642.1 twin-arginine translocase TatA/TatE family subunit [Corynebacterium sp.]MDN6387776.1 twin-arginine translocase TatA/TatE family subunit [Corynebacterium sp
MLQNLTGMHALVILAVVLLLFGAAKLPALAKSLGQSVRILKTEASDPAPAAATATAPAVPAAAATEDVAAAPTAQAPTIHTVNTVDDLDGVNGLNGAERKLTS